MAIKAVTGLKPFVPIVIHAITCTKGSEMSEFVSWIKIAHLHSLSEQV